MKELTQILKGEHDAIAYCDECKVWIHEVEVNEIEHMTNDDIYDIKTYISVRCNVCNTEIIRSD